MLIFEESATRQSLFNYARRRRYRTYIIYYIISCGGICQTFKLNCLRYLEELRKSYKISDVNKISQSEQHLANMFFFFKYQIVLSKSKFKKNLAPIGGKPPSFLQKFLHLTTKFKKVQKSQILCKISKVKIDPLIHSISNVSED